MWRTVMDAPDEWRTRLTSRFDAELWRDRLTDSGVFSGDTNAESLALLAPLLTSVTIDVGVSNVTCSPIACALVPQTPRYYCHTLPWLQ